MITTLELKNFAAFRDLTVRFGSKINVIIGENNFGKTQLLKAAYVLSVLGAAVDSDKKLTKAVVEQGLTDKLVKTFKPNGSRLGRLYHRGSDARAEISAEFSTAEKFGGSFTSRSRNIQLTGNHESLFDQGAVFIPTKEILTFLNGISSSDSDKATLNRLFDDTYFDLAENLLEQRNEDVEEKAEWFREQLINALGGQFEIDSKSVSFQEGEYRERKGRNASQSYFAPRKRSELSVAMTAEGYRKIGMLQGLLENQAIGTGVNGPLLWDEPDSNLNPKLMKTLVRILLELSRNSQQIILATHEYVLIKWFDLLMDKGKDDHVKFHTLFRDADSGEIQVHSTDDYREITPNPIAETFNELTDYEISMTMGGLGR